MLLLLLVAAHDIHTLVVGGPTHWRALPPSLASSSWLYGSIKTGPPACLAWCLCYHLLGENAPPPPPLAPPLLLLARLLVLPTLLSSLLSLGVRLADVPTQLLTLIGAGSRSPLPASSTAPLLLLPPAGAACRPMVLRWGR